MNITHSQCTVANCLANSLTLGRLERAFGHLAALVQTRSERRAAPTTEQPTEVKLSRSELFRQVQREKWLGKRPTGAATAARPKDLNRRVLIDPNA